MPISLNEVPANVTVNTPEADPSASVINNTGRNDVVQKLAAYKTKNASANRLQFPADLGKYYMKIQISEYSRASATTLNFTPTDTIILPMASTLNDQNTVRYEEGSLGPLGGEIADAIVSSWNNIGKTVTSASFQLKDLKTTISAALDGPGVVNHTNGIVDAAGLALGEAATGVVNKVTSKFGLGTTLPLNDVIGFAGFSPNQFFVVLMRGPTYKEYTFHWRLMPRNQAESDDIQNIVTTLNNASAVGLTDSKLFWKFPKVFRLEFVPNSAYLFKFKPAVIQSVQANYAPNGTPSFYKSGAPEAVDLTIVFKEMEYWLTGQFNNDTDPNAAL